MSQADYRTLGLRAAHARVSFLSCTIDARLVQCNMSSRGVCFRVCVCACACVCVRTRMRAHTFEKVALL
jgi:hypothetical protein